MNKQELIDSIANSADISKADAGKALDATLAAITGTLAQNKPVVLVGFGSFGTRKRAERDGRNPMTGEKITIKEATVPYFKAGKTLKQNCN